MTIQTKVSGAPTETPSFGYQSGIISVLAAELAALILEDDQIQNAQLDIENHKECPGAGLAQLKMASRNAAIHKREDVIEDLILRTQASDQSEALLQAILVRNRMEEVEDTIKEIGGEAWPAGLQSVINHLKSTGAELPARLARYYDVQKDT
jgi:hypothetical protein